MPGVYNQGSAARVRINGTLMGGLQNWDYQITRQTQIDEFYNGEPPDTSIGNATRRGTMSGKVPVGDAALATVKAAIEDDTGPTLTFTVSHDGVTAETVTARVSNLQTGGSNPAQKGTYQVQLEGAGVPVTGSWV